MNNLNKHTIEQLLKIVKENKKELFVKDITLDLDEATRFVLALGIKEGKNKVYSPSVYDAYKAWSPSPIKRLAFFQYFGRLFPRSQISGNKFFYLLNYKQVELLKEAQQLNQSE